MNRKLTHREINSRIKQVYLSTGRQECCEICGGTYNLSWHHRRKRRFYKLCQELLYALREFILVCSECHYRLEHGYTENGVRVKAKDLSDRIFLTLRGNEE